ncbi:hypothetical protein SAMN04488118_11245 [Epibacterium ulvae]|uniref:Uncharacterized protein n=1 Tax=Epibacterium ulvae TaxID=1156985 RepID=A0A1G5RCG2_9RHOB|nr:hypothetical protein [Epibacterium ulvae]SCZ71538.1 hypothetical protein SAMN04488118_11245 [Epibacterium ulvae]
MVSLGFGVGVTSVAAQRVRGFSPRTLFSSGEQGAFFDFKAGQMFQDLAAQIPVVRAGDRVALALSQSHGPLSDPVQDSLGPELSTRTYGTLAAGASVALAEPARTGAIYRLTYRISASDYTGDLFLRPAGGPFAYQVLDKTPGLHSYFVAAKDTQTGYMNLGGANPAGSITFDDISLRAVYAGHAVQSGGSAQQPIWQDPPSHLVFDQVDDALTTVLPDLGSNATEFWADETGVTLQPGQTIAAGLRVLPAPAQLFAYGVINRPLTGPEVAAVTDWLQKLSRP